MEDVDRLDVGDARGALSAALGPALEVHARVVVERHVFEGEALVEDQEELRVERRVGAVVEDLGVQQQVVPSVHGIGRVVEGGR